MKLPDATIPAARQLVGHGHVLVNGRRVDRPAYLVEVGDEISLSARARRIPVVAESVEHGPEVRLPSYLQLDRGDRFTGRMTGRPTRGDIPVVVDEAAIVELYAR